MEKMDLSSFNSIRECASKLNVILDKLIFSSIMLEKWHALYQEQRTDLRCRKEKIILGILINLLLPLLRKAAQALRETIY